MSEGAMFISWPIGVCLFIVVAAFIAAAKHNSEYYLFGVGLALVWPAALCVVLFVGALAAPYGIARGALMAVKWTSKWLAAYKLRCRSCASRLTNNKVAAGPYRTPPPTCPTCGRLSDVGAK